MESTILFILTVTIPLILTLGIYLLISQYQKKSKAHLNETQTIHLKHQHELQKATLDMQQLTMQDIGREIHDGVGQRLTLASIYTKQLAGKDISPEAKQKAEEISNILNESLGQLRSLSKELTSERDHEVDLQPLIREELNKMNDLQICVIEYTSTGEAPVSNKKAMFIVRILQEFLQNSLKYASCTLIKADLQRTDNELMLILSDNGKGFDTALESNGIGLQNMKRRAEMIDALLDIQSEPGKGTSLTLKLKFNS